jgi:hypothetical protein
MLGAGTRLSTGLDLSPIRKVTAKALDILIINLTDVIYTECADFAT